MLKRTSESNEFAINFEKNNNNATHLQQGMPDAAITSGDMRVVFSPSNERAAGNTGNWDLATKMIWN